MQHCAFIFARVKLSRQPHNCDSLSHIVYIKTLLRKVFIFSPSYWWFRILLSLRSIFEVQKEQISVLRSFRVHFV